VFSLFPACGRWAIFIKIHSKYRRHCKNRRPCQVKRLLSGSIRSFPIQTVPQISRPATCREATKSMERVIDQIRDGTRAAYRLARTLSQTFEKLPATNRMRRQGQIAATCSASRQTSQLLLWIMVNVCRVIGVKDCVQWDYRSGFCFKTPTLPVAIEFNSLLNLLLVEIRFNEILPILPLTIRPFSQCFNGTPNISWFYSNKSQQRPALDSSLSNNIIPLACLSGIFPLSLKSLTRHVKIDRTMSLPRAVIAVIIVDTAGVGLPFSVNFLSLSMSSQSRHVIR